MWRVESSVDSIKFLCRRASLTDLTSHVVCVRPPWLLQMLKGAQACLSFQIQKRTKQYLKQVCHGLCIHWFSCNRTVSIQLHFSTFYWLLTGAMQEYKINHAASCALAFEVTLPLLCFSL